MICNYGLWYHTSNLSSIHGLLIANVWAVVGINKCLNMYMHVK